MISAVIVISFMIMLQATVKTVFAARKLTEWWCRQASSYSAIRMRGAEDMNLRAFYIDRYEVTNEAYGKFKHDHKYPADKAKHPVV